MKTLYVALSLSCTAWMFLTACGGDDSADPSPGAGGAVATTGGADGSGGGATGGGDPSGGSDGSGGAVGGREIIGVPYTCDPACESYEYCVIEEIDCDDVPCFARAVCKERPHCTLDNWACEGPAAICGVGDTRVQGCVDEECPRVCGCNDPGCGGQGLVMDWRPGVCDCVEPWASGLDCLDVRCGSGFQCNMINREPICLEL